MPGTLTETGGRDATPRPVKRQEMGGNWYTTEDPPMEDWLCPALFRYFESAPAELHVRPEAK